MLADVLILCRESTMDVESLRETLERRGATVLTHSPSELELICAGREVCLVHGGVELLPRVVVGWTSLWESHYGNILLRALKQLGIPVLNGHEVLAVGQSKALTSALLALGNLPHVPTVVCGSGADLERAIAYLGLPIVVKPQTGAKGDGVALLHSRAELDDWISRNRRAGEPIYLQRFVQTPGRDLRIQCARYRPLFGLYRYVPEGGFTANCSQGGRAELCDPLPERAHELAERAAALFRAPMAGVDLIECPDEGWKILEVNTVPGFYTVLKYAGPEAERLRPYAQRAAEIFADMIEERLDEPTVDRHR